MVPLIILLVYLLTGYVWLSANWDKDFFTFVLNIPSEKVRGKRQNFIASLFTTFALTLIWPVFLMIKD